MIVAGFGFSTSATAASLDDALSETGGAPDRIATATDKSQTHAFRALAQAHNLPVVAVSQNDLLQTDTFTQSAASEAARQTGSVAEAAALAAAGPGARLLGPRAISQDRQATCALAESAPS